MAGGRDDGDEAAHGVPDDDRSPVDAGVAGDRHHLVGPLLGVVVVAVRAVAVSGQVDGGDPELTGERRRHVGPPVGVCAAAVHEDEAAPAGPAPGHVVDGCAVDLDPSVLALDGHGAGEPRRGVGQECRLPHPSASTR
jgi:hypothetical protein